MRIVFAHYLWKTSFYSLPFFVLQLLGAQLRRVQLDDVLVPDEGAQAKVLMPREEIKAIGHQFTQKKVSHWPPVRLPQGQRPPNAPLRWPRPRRRPTGGCRRCGTRPAGSPRWGSRARWPRRTPEPVSAGGRGRPRALPRRSACGPWRTGRPRGSLVRGWRSWKVFEGLKCMFTMSSIHSPAA